MKNGGRIVQKTKLIILLASFYILGVAAFFTGHVMSFAAVVLVLLIFALFKNYLSSLAVFFAYLFFMLAILNSNFQIKDCDDLCKYAENNITLTGTVLSIPTTNSDDLTKFYFKPIDGIFNAQNINNLKARTIVTVYGNKSEYSKIKIGDKIKLQGKLKLPQEAQNPSQFDYRKYLKNHKTYTVMYVKNGNWSIVSSPTSLSWKFLQKLNNKRMDILNIHKNYLKSPNLEVLGGIVFGDDAINPPDSIRDSFINSGLLHILAASGMNVSIIFGMWYFIAVRLRINYRFILIFGAILVAAYTLMTGMGPSVLRAALMIELVLLGKFFDRDADSFSLIFFVAMALLVYNPAMITDIGFQLSFIVTFALMFYCPPVLEKINNKFLDILTGALLIPIVAQLWAAPIQMYYFNTFATYSVLANFLISPLITAISFLGFVGSTLASRSRVSPDFIVVETGGVIETFVTFIGFTVIVQVADLSPAFAVMIAVPTEFAVTLPFESTVAIVVSLEVHVTSLLVASSGKTVAVSFSSAPTNISASVLLSVMLSTGITFSSTVIVHSSVTPSTVALIVAVPTDLAVTLPF